MTVGVAVQAMLEGMPLAADLRRAEVDGEVLIAVGTRVLFRYAAGDAGLRNMAAVTLPAAQESQGSSALVNHWTV